MLHIENQDYNRDQFGFYSLDDLVPQDHLLRQIEEAIDFSFIYDLVADSISRDVCLHSEALAPFIFTVTRRLQ